MGIDNVPVGCTAGRASGFSSNSDFTEIRASGFASPSVFTGRRAGCSSSAVEKLHSP